MIISENPLSAIIPSNKFYPPHIDESLSLVRTGLLSTKLPKDIAARKIILIEAQAGQGKTTLAFQFLNHYLHDYVWYQVGPEDSDPVFLLSALLANLTNKFPDFGSSELSYIFAQGAVGPLDLNRCANILLRDLDKYLTHDIYITFDDLHLLPSGAMTNSLLEYLIDASPPRLHFILISRHPVELKCKVLRNGMSISYLNTTDLALNSMEIEDLFNNVLDKTINRQEAMEIERITGGWIMGIVLASHPVSGREKFWQKSMAPVASSFEHGHMLEYFQDEIFDQIPASLHLPFFRLSFITEIPVDLAISLTGIQDMETILSDMARENFFVYKLDDSQRVFRFHHFFQEFLQLQAGLTLSAAEINTIHTVEAEYYLKKNMLEKALACYRNAGDYKTMDTILQHQGMLLIEKNRTLTILSLLQTIPQETLFQYSWLTVYAGLLRVDFVPQTTLPFFDAARARFIADGEEVGEIITLSQTIYFHFVISGLYNLGGQILPRTEELFKKNEATLPVHVRIMAARNLASGFCFFVSNMDKAREYATLANDLATRHDMRNFIASTRFALGYIELLSGNIAQFLREAENCFSLINDPLVGMSNKLTLRVMHLCYLSMTGDFQNFLNQQQELQESIDQKVTTQTVAAPYLYVWGCSCFVSMGEIEKGQEVLARGFDISATARIHHMHSQLLQWQAFISAIKGDKEQARSTIEESTRLRAIAGGPFYQAFQLILTGAIYTRTGDTDQAVTALEHGIRMAASIPSPYLHACGLLHRSYLDLLCSDQKSALANLREGLSMMKKHNYSHFWSWEPVMMTRLLSMSMAAGIEKEFVATLARKRLRLAFSDNGTLIPLLRIQLLDNFSIIHGKYIVFRIDDFTASQRELFGLMLTAKGQKIDQEKSQLYFWPDSSPEKARKKFDTLLGRLRKNFSDNITVPVQNYIVMNKGFLCLHHAETDSLQFMEASRAVLAHSRKKEWWQAGNSCHHALSLWKGSLPTDTFTNEYASSWEMTLLDTFTTISMTWGTHLAATGRIDEAIQIVENILLSNGLEEKAVVLLCDLYTRNNMPVKIRKTLERYRKALEDIDYTKEEIEEIIAEITDHTKK
jgi:LuxR family transcriptional regulator, maltose regulon positive regulatory protein